MRHLSPDLKEMFDEFFSRNPLSVNPNEAIADAAMSCMGIVEEGGDNQGRVVSLFQSTITRPQGQSWCLDFVQSCIAYVEIVKGVLSPLPSTELVLDFWNKSKGYNAVASPQKGDIILWQLGGTIHGHTGIILSSDSLRYQTIEGNTSNSAELDRNGDGVYFKSRAKGGSKSFIELGFLRAFQK